MNDFHPSHQIVGGGLVGEDCYMHAHRQTMCSVRESGFVLRLDGEVLQRSVHEWYDAEAKRKLELVKSALDLEVLQGVTVCCCCSVLQQCVAAIRV